MRALRASGRWGGMVVMVGATAVLGAVGVAAQERPESPCSCVDEAGDRIERCVCVVAPEFPARRPLLGVSIQPQQTERDDTQGARVYGVIPDGPAAEAGLQEGDILVRVGNQSLLEPLSSEDEEELDRDGSLPVQRLLAVVAEAEPGESLELEFIRDGAPRMAVVVLERTGPYFRGGPGHFDFSALGAGPLSDVAREYARDVQVRVMPDFRREVLNSGSCPAGAPADGEWRGMLDFGRSCVAGLELVELNEGLAEYFEAEEGDVLVYEAEPDNSLTVLTGDVILAVDGREVRSVEHARRVIGSYEAEEVLNLRVLRRGQQTELRGRLR